MEYIKATHKFVKGKKILICSYPECERAANLKWHKTTGESYCIAHKEMVHPVYLVERSPFNLHSVAGMVTRFINWVKKKGGI